MNRRTTCLVLLSAFVQSIAALANTAVVLDQAYLDEDGDFGIGEVAAQTFTVGIAGTLSRVDLRLGVTSNPEGNVFVFIRNAEGHSPGTVTNLGAVTLPRIDLPFPIQHDDYISLDFSSQDIRVNAGEVLAIVVDIGDLPGITWGLGETVQSSEGLPVGGYTGGFALGGLTNNLPVIGYDFNFRTFVQTIPEHSTLTLTAGALLGLVGYFRRRGVAT